MKILKILLAVLLFSGCTTLKPAATEYNLLRTFSNTVNLHEYGNGKVLLYNGAGINHKIDDTDPINIWINGKPLGQLQSNQYAVLFLMPDKYEFKVQHRDLGMFESVHAVLIDGKTSVVKVTPTITSNKVEITNEIPENFQKYKNVLN